MFEESFYLFDHNYILLSSYKSNSLRFNIEVQTITRLESWVCEIFPLQVRNSCFKSSSQNLNLFVMGLYISNLKQTLV